MEVEEEKLGETHRGGRQARQSMLDEAREEPLLLTHTLYQYIVSKRTVI